jgi:hypothetical protein
LSASRRAPSPRVALLLFLVASGILLFTAPVLALSAASPSLDSEPPPPRTLPIEGAEDFVGTWSYRWGDSPRDGNGALTWLRPPDPPAPGAASPADPGFAPLGKQEMPSPPGRNGQRFLWLRTTLDGPAVHDATLYIEIVDQLFEAYLDGQRIYSFGDLDGARRFLGYPIHFVPLGDGYRGQTLTLRIYSEHINIGLFGRLRIGSKARLIAEALRQDIGRMFVGFVVCAIGLFSFVLSFNERKERAYLYYALFAFNVGLWMLCQMRVRCLLLDRPLLWTHIEFFSLYTNVAALALFLSRTLGRGPLGVMPILARVYVVFDAGAALLVATGVVGIMATLLPFQALLAFGLFYTLSAIVSGLRKGDIEAKLFALGLSLTVGFVGYDLLMVLGFLPRVVSVSYFGHGSFAVAMGAILIHRFRLVHRDLITTKQALSDKVRALESRNAEVEQLNDALRHQIEARSRQLISSILGEGSSSQDVIKMFSAGALLGERYRVLRTIGQGAMGVVYEVERIQDGRRFAAKVLAGRSRRQDLARFAREAQVLARLKHKNLVTIADVDVTDSRLAYIIMELVEGKTLADHAQRYGELGFVLPILRQLADALATVHAEGVVHRDLKPANGTPV